MSDVEQLREIMDQLGKSDRMELRLSVEFSEAEDISDGGKIETHSLTPRRRQYLQKLGLVERIPGGDASYVDRQRCHLTDLGLQVAKLLIEEDEARIAERRRIKADIDQARQSLRDAGRWESLVESHPVLKTSPSSASEARLDEMHKILMSV